MSAFKAQSPLHSVGSKMLFFDGTRSMEGTEGAGAPAGPRRGGAGGAGAGGGVPPSPARSARPGTSGSRRPGTSGGRPGTSGGRRKGTQSHFKRYLDRGDLPAKLESRGGGGTKLVWLQDPRTLDLHVFLPVFLDGLREQKDPFKTLALEGTFELLELAGPALADMVGLLIKPLKDALTTRVEGVLRSVMKVLQEIAANRECAVALVPHYRMLLPTFNLLLAKRASATSTTAGIEAVHGHSLGDLVLETLETLELAAGPTASGSIRQFVPGYNSCFTGKKPSSVAANRPPPTTRYVLAI